MKPIKTFTVTPALPAEITRLTELAHNLRWSWDYDTRSLFRRLDRELWESCGRNPVAMLGLISQERLEEAARDTGFLAHYNRVSTGLDNYLHDTQTWFRQIHRDRNRMSIAYFSAEFAISDCMAIYSGGLGVLAGDHLKSASNLDLPLTGVGLLYQKGYLRQHLTADGWQQETASENDFYTLPVKPVLDGERAPLKIRVPMDDHEVVAQLWCADIGRIKLYLLDTNLPENSPDEREITAQLYGGDNEMRLRQEIVLGIGGMRALMALGITPQVCHMNEGHTAFVALERIRQLVRTHGLSFSEAKEVARAGHVFTTHTPVAAGNDYFPPHLMEHYFHSYYRELDVDLESFLALGRLNVREKNEAFCMTVLALRLSSHNNAVSRLHEAVTREMWSALWPQTPRNEIPISHVTNGIHTESWISHDLTDLLDAYLGPVWREKPGDQSVWQWVSRIPEEELWRTHERRRERLIAFSRRRLVEQLQRRGASQQEINDAQNHLDPQAFTIGFARRFASYKRPLLILRDPERLARLLNNPERPVQLIFAGKAHPRDDLGKNMIRELIHLSRQPVFRKKIVFLEDYDLDVARYMVQGVDVWLNTPQRPMEASGTSGMKAAVNGVLNVSILDGWWDEAYSPDVGWAIGLGADGHLTPAEDRDQIEADALYNLLEEEIVPLFYERKEQKMPRYWVRRMKQSMGALCPRFNTHRMVCEYAERFYLPAYEHFVRVAATDFSPAKELAAWKNRICANWGEVRIVSVDVDAASSTRVGDRVRVTAQVRLGQLSADDVDVQVCLGRVDANNQLIDTEIVSMDVTAQKEGLWTFEKIAMPCCRSGLHGLTVRVLPSNPHMLDPWELGIVHWAG